MVNFVNCYFCKFYIRQSGLVTIVNVCLSQETASRIVLPLPHSNVHPTWSLDYYDMLAYVARWRHQMETFSALLAICAGNSPVPGEFPAQRPVTRSFDVFFDLHPNKRLSKQWWGWWFETPSCPLWRHRNEIHASQQRFSNLMSDWLVTHPPAN